MVSDGTTNSVAASVTVTINENQPATFAGALTGSITEDDTTAIDGTITVDDADDANTVQAQNDGATYGTFSIDTDGVWSYTLNNAHDDVNALAAGATLIDTIEVRAADGTVGTITITINGVNDAPTATATVVDATVVEGGTVSLQGAGTDPDTGDTITSYTWTQTSPATPSLIAGAENRQNPSFLASDAGVYTFSLVVNDGDADSAPSTVVVTITPNQPATFTGALTGSITEDGTTATDGTITVTDADDANTVQAQNDGATTYGTFSIDTDGVWSYTLDNAHADVNALAAGDTRTDTIEVRAADGTVGTITITINGVNDAPVIAASVSTLNAVAGTAIVPVTISSTGGTVARYAISPAIENGLIFSTATGTISGTPTDAATVVMYRITATNTAGDDTAAVDITVPNSYSATSTVLATSSTNSEGLAVITLGQTSGNNIEATRATITLPSGLSGATITVATLADDSQALPAAQPEETVADSQRSLVDIDVTGDNSNTISRTNPVTICLPYGELANPGLYHAAVTGAEAVWGLLPSQRVETNPNLVCGDAASFSPFAVFENVRSLDAAAETQVLNAVLPQLLRATTKITVDNISNRIDQALNASASTDTRLNLGGSSNLQELINNNVRTVLESELDVKQMLNNSSFLIPLNVAGDNNYGVNNMTLWGSGDYLNLSDDVSGVDWEGEIVGGSVGIDARLSRNLVAGAAVSYSEGDIDYKRADSANNSKGTLTNTLYSIHPYLGYDLSQSGRIWGTFGYGQGEVEISEQGTSADETSNRDTELYSLAFGGSGDLLSSNSWLNMSGTTTLRLKGEVSLSNIKVDKSDLTDAKALSIDAHRYRMALEGSHNHTLASGASISPSIELGVRYDDGSGDETGGGVELAGSYRYSNPQGLEMELRAHGLLAHESDYKEWGLSGLVKYQANSSGQGLWLSLQPAWGDTPSNVADRIWQPAAVTDYANDEDSNGNRNLQLNTELGYGLPGFFGRGLLTPYAGLNMTNDSQGYNIGARWAIDSRLNLDLIGEHKQTDDSIQLRVDLKF
ncbi:MAG: hypothetical protein A6F72_05280 [Cycloclasticus sp. symbiont of Poecilosclerida sp. N]|nr:MAG: hypothetical protein A6F72_05280 [Cycloclasticus sp. symbiont of Poecilosclerida sp. N]